MIIPNILTFTSQLAALHGDCSARAFADPAFEYTLDIDIIDDGVHDEGFVFALNVPGGELQSANANPAACIEDLRGQLAQLHNN